MAGAEEVVEGIERVEGVVYAGLALNDKRLRPAARDGARRGALRVRRERDVQPAQPGNDGRGLDRSRRSGSSRRAREDGIRATRDDRHLLRLPVRGRGRPGARARARRRRRAGGRGRDRFRGHGRRRRPQAGPRARLRGASSSARRSASTSTTRARPASRTPTRRSRPARPSSTHRSAASAAARSRRERPATSRPRTSSTCSHGEGIETGVDLDALIGVAQWLEGVLGRPLEGQVYRAGSFAPVAG